MEKKFGYIKRKQEGKWKNKKSIGWKLKVSRYIDDWVENRVIIMLFLLSPPSFFHLSSPLKALDIKYSCENGLYRPASITNVSSIFSFNFFFPLYSFILPLIILFLFYLKIRTDLRRKILGNPITFGRHLEIRYNPFGSLNACFFFFYTSLIIF